jgi:hypothetical protein
VSDLNGFSAILPTSISGLIGDLGKGINQEEVAALVQWWNGFAKKVFDSLTAADAEGKPMVDPVTAAQIVFKQLPQPKQVQRLSLRMVGSVTTIINRASANDLKGSIGFTGLAGLPVSLSVGGEVTNQQSSAQQSQFSDELTLDMGPALSALPDALITALAEAKLPALPDFTGVPGTSAGPAPVVGPR